LENAGEYILYALLVIAVIAIVILVSPEGTITNSTGNITNISKDNTTAIDITCNCQCECPRQECTYPIYYWRLNTTEYEYNWSNLYIGEDNIKWVYVNGTNR
jgi:hypothetical protein